MKLPKPRPKAKCWKIKWGKFLATPAICWNCGGKGHILDKTDMSTHVCVICGGLGEDRKF